MTKYQGEGTPVQPLSAAMQHDAARALVRADVASVVGTLSELQLLRGKMLLVTGGTGFLGTWFLETVAYLNEGWSEPCRVYVPTRDPEAFARKAPHLATRAEFVFERGDMRRMGLPDKRFDYIIHAAAAASPLEKARAPVEVGASIVSGAQWALELARRDRVEGCLLVSSGAVYGDQPPALERVPEDYLGGPDLSAAYSSYAEGKRYAEVLAVAYHQTYGVPVTIARPFTAVGAYQDLHAGFAATDFVRDALHGNPISVRGDGTTVRSYCSASEYVQALWGVLLRGQAGRVYNVGSDQPISVLEFAQAVAQAVGDDIPIRIALQATPGSLPERYVPDIGRLDKELGLRPRISAEDAVKRYVAWARLAAAPAATNVAR